jgi:hypothetical protein
MEKLEGEKETNKDKILKAEFLLTPILLSP